MTSTPDPNTNPDHHIAGPDLDPADPDRELEPAGDPDRRHFTIPDVHPYPGDGGRQDREGCD